MTTSCGWPRPRQPCESFAPNCRPDESGLSCRLCCRRVLGHACRRTRSGLRTRLLLIRHQVSGMQRVQQNASRSVLLVRSNRDVTSLKSDPVSRVIRALRLRIAAILALSNLVVVGERYQRASQNALEPKSGHGDLALPCSMDDTESALTLLRCITIQDVIRRRSRAVRIGAGIWVGRMPARSTKTWMKCP